MSLPPIIMMQDYSYTLYTEYACWVYPGESVSNIELVLSVTSFAIWGCMCSAGPFEFRWLKDIWNLSYYPHKIGSICPWLHVSDGCTITFCHLLRIHVYPGNIGSLFPLFMCSLCCVQMISYIMIYGSCSFVCTYSISLSSFCRLIQRHWTSKMLVRNMLSSGCPRLS